MKPVRFMALALTLAAATIATADYYLTVDGQAVTEALVRVGQPVTIGLWSTNATVPPEPTPEEVGGDMFHTLTIGAVSLPSFGAGYGSFSDPEVLPAAGSLAVTGYHAISPWLLNEFVYNGWSQEDPNDQVAGQWFEWTFTPLMEGDGALYLFTWDADYNATTYQILNLEAYACPDGDLNSDCKVDLLDFCILSQHWLERVY